ALLLASYISARQDWSMFESPADSARHVVYGNGTAAGWDEAGSRTAIASIREGGSPDISGASGTLDYDKEFGVDPLVAYYAHWIVENQTFRTAEVLDSDKSGTAAAPGESTGRSRSSSSYMQALPNNTGNYVPLEERKELRAVIVGPSRGWSNYRHQADALTMYTMLRENGVPDDHIILMVYDDIPTLPENPVTGDIHHQPKGKNLRNGAMVDYEGREVTSATLKNVLTGNKTDTSPVVLESTGATNVLVYIVSHGNQGEILFSGNNAPFTSADFVEVTDSMNCNGKYRQMVFMVDTCFGESIAVNATAPGVLFFTGASRSEPSLGAVYDPDIQQWLSDEFTTTVVDLIVAEPDISLRKLYIRSYERVTGSHVRMLNAEN
ncbi:MAG: hypothetical protein CVV34_06825, partial [Methanomicrobiales archaeon HGW-Methanomicrobiales-5]